MYETLSDFLYEIAFAFSFLYEIAFAFSFLYEIAFAFACLPLSFAFSKRAVIICV